MQRLIVSVPCTQSACGRALAEMRQKHLASDRGPVRSPERARVIRAPYTFGRLCGQDGPFSWFRIIFLPSLSPGGAISDSSGPVLIGWSSDPERVKRLLPSSTGGRSACQMAGECHRARTAEAPQQLSALAVTSPSIIMTGNHATLAVPETNGKGGIQHGCRLPTDSQRTASAKRVVRELARSLLPSQSTKTDLTSQIPQLKVPDLNLSLRQGQIQPSVRPPPELRRDFRVLLKVVQVAREGS
ncbi:hypothetical protein CSOJ01_08128 [Colletotrichum sojae]|uniref:Uncharacterized protein n=1 Tax=Colletotrichum sojae TaxID=2175907 RepID=A0A8H6J6P8_9PEZI|nr:hypothetical protein CSOJ01_08128 [Colletotrichum sojae]